MNHLYIVLAIVLISASVQATFSFGGALIALPLLAFIIDIKVATPLMTMLSCSIALIITLNKWRDIQVSNAWRLIISACLGIPFGILFLSHVEGRVLKIVLALTVILFTLLNVFTFKRIHLSNVNYAFVFGGISGIFGGAYNISGPPVVLYGSLTNWDSDRFRATIQSYALFTNIFAIVGHYLAGNLTCEVVTYYGWSLPVVGITIWLGNLIHRVIPGERYAVYVKILLLLLGLNLFYSSIT
jgi:uncharacterized membrane protein YfcA